MIHEDQVDTAIEKIVTVISHVTQNVPLERSKSQRAAANSLVKLGIGWRLKGAYALYKTGNELECIRHILLALASLCCILGWKKTEAYLNEQNAVLYAMYKKESEGS